MQKHEKNLEKYDKLKTQYENLHKFYQEVVLEMQEMANNTLIQPTIYYEQENF